MTYPPRLTLFSLSGLWHFYLWEGCVFLYEISHHTAITSYSLFRPTYLTCLYTYIDACWSSTARIKISHHLQLFLWFWHLLNIPPCWPQNHSLVSCWHFLPGSHPNACNFFSYRGRLTKRDTGFRTALTWKLSLWARIFGDFKNPIVVWHKSGKSTCLRDQHVGWFDGIKRTSLKRRP